MDSAIALRGDGIQSKDTFPTGSAEEEADVAKTGFPYTHTKGKVQRQSRAIWCCCENYKKGQIRSKNTDLPFILARLMPSDFKQKL